VAGRRSPVTDIREILRRLHLGEPDRRVARDLGISRNTVAHYRIWAARQGVLSDGPVPDPPRSPRCWSGRRPSAPPIVLASQERAPEEPGVVGCYSASAWFTPP
jgi:hypothetical protein